MNRKTAIIAMMNGEILKFTNDTLYRWNNTRDNGCTESSTSSGKSWQRNDYGFNTEYFNNSVIWEAPKKLIAFKHTRDGSVSIAEENSPQFRALKSNHYYEQLELTQDLMIAASKK